jgi:hypothetical protein
MSKTMKIVVGLVMVAIIIGVVYYFYKKKSVIAAIVTPPAAGGAEPEQHTSASRSMGLMQSGDTMKVFSVEGLTVQQCTGRGGTVKHQQNGAWYCVGGLNASS